MPLPLFFGGGGVWKGLWVLGGGLFCFVGWGLFRARGQIFRPDRRRGGGVRELLTLSGARGHVFNAAPALHLRLQDTSTTGQIFG